MRLIPIVEISRAVGDLVGHIDKLRFQRWTKLEQILSQFWMLIDRIIVRVFDDALANFERQVESAKGRIAQLEVFHDAQGVQVVVEKISMLTHGKVERFFSRMSEWRMSHVMRPREGFNHVHVQAKLARNGSGDLRDFNGVGQAITKMVGMAAGENLGFCLKPAKGPGGGEGIAVT